MIGQTRHVQEIFHLTVQDTEAQLKLNVVDEFVSTLSVRANVIKLEFISLEFSERNSRANDPQAVRDAGHTSHPPHHCSCNTDQTHGYLEA